MFRSFDPDDAVARLASLTNNLSGKTNDLTATFAYNPASGITSTVRTGDTYAWTGHGNGSTAFTQNGLNQQITVGGSAASWDSKGNLTSEPQSAKTYGYSSENLLTSASGGVALAYDPSLRLYQIAGAATTRFAYDGVNAVAEYNGSNALQRRFVFGPGIDEPIVQYEGTGTSDRRFMSADERGSIISLTDSSGTLLNINRYDEYGKPQSTNVGRFQYTGQKWITELGAYDYKARVYLPHLGIFAQTDPIGYADSPNLYAYVGNDPLNLSDPSGTVGGSLDTIESETGGGQMTPGAAGLEMFNFQLAGVPISNITGRFDEIALNNALLDATFRQSHNGMSQECWNSLSCLSQSITQAAAPGTSISNIPQNSNEYYWRGEGDLSYGLINPIKYFDVTTYTRLEIDTYSINMVVAGEGWPGFFSIGGGIGINFYQCTGWLGCGALSGGFPLVRTGGWTPNYYEIPLGAHYVGVNAIEITPDDTRYQIWAH